MSTSTTDRIALLEARIKTLEAERASWSDTVSRQNRALHEKEEEIQRLKRKLELINQIIDL